MISSELLIEDTSRLELLSELHDELVEHSVGGSLVIFVVSHGCGSDAVQSHPAVALANIVLERD